MAYADYRDLITMTEHLLESLAVELYGSSHVLIPQFDMDQKTITKGDKAGSQAKEVKTLEFNFKGPYQKFDVCETLDIDPLFFKRSPEEMTKELAHRVRNIKEIRVNPETLNEKQLIDKLIEHHIES